MLFDLRLSLVATLLGAGSALRVAPQPAQRIARRDAVRGLALAPLFAAVPAFASAGVSPNNDVAYDGSVVDPEYRRKVVPG